MLSTLGPSLALAQQHREINRPSATHTDVWSEPNPGIRYLHRRTTTPCSIHALVIDLSHPGVRIRATPYDQRWSTVSEYATANHLAAATNGGFWGMLQRAEGVAAGGGRRWPTGSDDDEIGYFAVTRAGRAWISPPEIEQDDIAGDRLAEGVSGRPMIVRHGQLDQASLDAYDYSNLRHPRSSVGVSRDGKKVVLIVADGRQGHSRGMTLYEMGRMMVELGAYDAINLDGGGSSTMFVAQAGGIVNSPSGGRWEAKLGLGAARARRARSAKTRVRDDGIEEVFLRGIEREVMNHIGVIAGPPAGGTAASRTTGPRVAGAGAGSVEVVLQPRGPALRLGRSREVLYPILFGAGVASPFLIAAYVVWRRRRRRRREARAREHARVAHAPAPDHA